MRRRMTITLRVPCHLLLSERGKAIISRCAKSVMVLPRAAARRHRARGMLAMLTCHSGFTAVTALTLRRAFLHDDARRFLVNNEAFDIILQRFRAAFSTARRRPPPALDGRCLPRLTFLAMKMRSFSRRAFQLYVCSHYFLSLVMVATIFRPRRRRKAFVLRQPLGVAACAYTQQADEAAHRDM